MSVFGGRTTRIIIMGLIVLGAGAFWGVSRFALKRFSICEVQGNGEISRHVGEKVIVQGIVSADLSGVVPGGFFLVDRDCPEDDGSSQGIFVEVDNFGEIVHLGDEVQVQGLVEEIGGETRIRCDLSDMEILSLGNDLPPGINLQEEFLRDADSFQYEKWEGMLVSFPKGELLKGFMDSDLPRILPLFDLDPNLQVVCLHNPSITLQLSSSEENKALDKMYSGDLVQSPTGILRQNITGYFLELISDYDLKVIGRKSSQGLSDGSKSAELILTGTQEIYTSGTPSVITTGAPTSMIVPSPTIIPSPTYYPVHLLISEFYPNPKGKEPDGEWVEIYNPKPYAQPLTGVKLGDETSATGKEGMLRFPDGYYIESQEVLIVAHQAKAFFSAFGFLPDFEMEDSDARIPDLLPYSGWGRSGIQFSNSGDEVVMLDPWDGVVDLLVYGSSNAGGFSDPSSAPKEGNSLERYPPDIDRDRGGDWREREGVSPGRLDRSPPTQAVVPTQKPSSTFTISPSPSPSGTASITTTESAASPSPSPSATPPTSTPSYIPSLSPTLAITNSVAPTQEPSLSLTVSPWITPTPSPSISVTNGHTWTPSITARYTLTWTPSTTLSPTTTGTILPFFTTTVTAIVPGTPIPSVTPSQPPTVTGTAVHMEDLDILLNEIHADPDLILGDANNDSHVHSDDDEFLEFVNIGENDLDLSGWSVRDSLRLRYLFPDGTVLKRGCAVLVFGGGQPQGDFGGSLILVASSLSLNNAGDVISLSDSNGIERLSTEYGLEGGENQSLTRSPDIFGGMPLALHSEAAGSNGNLYSPGVMLDGSVFGDCP